MHNRQIHFIKWEKPDKKEPIANYAVRLAKQIITTNPVLIGLSFGGIMAVEVAKIISVSQIILIASAKRFTEIPWYYRLAGKCRLHKLLPTSLLKKSSFITNWFFGVKTPAHKQLLAEILRDTDKEFLLWAINAIVSWRNTTVPQKLIHIHGTADRILPCRFVHADIIIKDGSHFMTVNKAAELSKILNEVLDVQGITGNTI